MTQHATVKASDTVYTVNGVQYPMEWPVGTGLILKLSNKTLTIAVNGAVVKTISDVDSYRICGSINGGVFA